MRCGNDTREGCQGSAGCGIFNEEADDRGYEDTDEDASLHLEDHQGAGDDDTDDGEEGLAVADVAERDEGRVIVGDDPGILETDECDEQADTGTDRMFERKRNGIEDPGTDLREGQDDKDDTLKENSRQGELPAMAHTEADSKYEEGVQAHTRGKGKRFLGKEGHDQRTDEGSQGGCRKDGTGRHVEGAEDARIDGEDIRHRKERGNTGDDLGPHGMLLGIKAESFTEEVAHQSD